jgi:MoaA/NifB/PqqE/SkfB family radical SAM enzyme
MFTLNTKISILKALITKSSPFYVQFFITKQCNLHCQMCNIVQSNKGLEDVSLEKIRDIASNLRKIGAGIVLLTGGEPFFRKDIPEIVKILKAEKLDVRLQTHGFRTNRELIKECLRNGAVDINISLDTLNESLQDSINQVPLSWRSALETISYITNAFPEKNRLCAFGCVLSRYNYKEVPDIVRFASEIGWYVSLVPVHTSDAKEGYNFRSRSKSMAFDAIQYDEVDETIDQLISMRKRGYALFDSIAYLESCKNFIRTGKPIWRDKKTGVCDSPGLYFAIRPDGAFAPCCDHNFTEPLFVYEKNFPKIYKSNSFKAKVKTITSKCVGCQFGSYPEVTLSVRNGAAFAEHLRDTLSSQLVKKRAYSFEELLEIIRRIRSEKVD